MFNYFLIIILAAFPALSTDMYLPSMSVLQKTWGVDYSIINQSLSWFFISFAFSLLLFGPLSDKFGRKKILYSGISLFILSSIACAIATNAEQLVLFRVLQGCGAASASALSLTLAKDLFYGNELKKALAITGIIVPLVPLTAPVLGSWVMAISSWRVIFLIQAALGIVALFGCMLMDEPPFKKNRNPITQLFAPYKEFLGNKEYLTNLISLTIGSVPFFMFLSASNHIYIDVFGIRPGDFGLYIGFNAIALISGAFLCSKIAKKVEEKNILLVSFTGTLIPAFIMFFSHSTSYTFAILMFSISFFTGLSRPICNHIILKNVINNTGSATSLLNFTIHILGAVGMYIITLSLELEILSISIVAIMGSIIGLTNVVKTNKHVNQKNSINNIFH